MSGADPLGVGDGGAAGAVEAGGTARDVPRAPVAGAVGDGEAAAGPCPSAERTPGMSRYAPIPPRTTTMPRKASTRWAGLRSMTVRYFFRRTGRSQKGPGGLESAPGPPWSPPLGPGPAWPPREGGAADWPPPRPLPEPPARPPPEPLLRPRSGGAAFRDGPRPGLLLRDGLPQKPEPPPWLLLRGAAGPGVLGPGSPPRGAALRAGPLPRAGTPLRAGAPRDGADPNVGGAAPGPGPPLPPDAGGAAAGGRGATPGQRCRAAPGRAGADPPPPGAAAGAPEARPAAAPPAAAPPAGAPREGAAPGGAPARPPGASARARPPAASAAPDL